MRGRFIGILEDIRASFWFVPALMAAGAIVLSVFTISIDQAGTQQWLVELGFIFLNQPGGAQSLLSTIAGSLMNVAGVVFSLTIVALTLASQQFGPRLLGNFMRDRGNQTVLGTFVATFLYCLLVLRTVTSEGDEREAFVPHLSVTIALLLAIVTLGAAIYFIHHIASSIQVENVIGKVSAALERHVAGRNGDDIFPAHIGRSLPRAELPEQFDSLARPIPSHKDGYLQAVDGDGLLRLARRHDAVIRLRYRPGTFILRGATVAEVFPGDREEVVDELRKHLTYGIGRNQIQDTEALFDQLLELALRALSPSTNDPFTAIGCVNRIAAALLELARRDLPSPLRGDEDEKLRVVAPPLDYPALAARMFSSLRAHASRELFMTSQLLLRLRSLRQELDEVRDEPAPPVGDSRWRRFAEGDPHVADLKTVLEREYDALLASSRERLDDSDWSSLVEKLAGEGLPGQAGQ